MPSKIRRRYTEEFHPEAVRLVRDAAHRFPVAANHLNRQFTVTVPNQVWASDLP